MSFDPAKISYHALISNLFLIVDVSQKSSSSLERLMLIPHNEDQYRECQDVLARVEQELGHAPYIEVEMFQDFSPAPQKEFNYYLNNKDSDQHCKVYIGAKVGKFVKYARR